MNIFTTTIDMVSKFPCLLLVGLLLVTQCTLLHAPPAYYPRLALVSNSTTIGAVFESPSTNKHALLFARSQSLSPTTPWLPPVDIVTSTEPNVDLANGFLLQLHTTGTILCAYRHHTGDGPSRVYRIQVSSSADSGATFTFLSTVTQGPVGVWEPFLFQDPADPPTTITVYYSAECTNGGEQDVVAQTSTDGGVHWGPVTSRIHTPGSRNGMPGVIKLGDGSLLAVFEGFWGPGGWGHFTVNSARSFDKGASWVQRQVVHVPVEGNSGSPQVGLCVGGGEGGAEEPAVCTVYMSNEGGGGGGVWPSGAHLSTICVQQPLAASEALNFTAGVPRVFHTDTPEALWPAFVGGGGGDLFWLVYQTPEGAAAFNPAGGICV